MKRLLIGVLMVLSMLTLAGCTTVRLSPVVEEDPSRKVIYVDGNEAIVSQGRETAVVVGAIRTEDYELILHVAYINNSSTDINALPDMIGVRVVNKAGEEKDLKVYSADEYLHKLRTAQAWEAFGQALSAASSSYQAGYSTTYTSGSAYAYGSGGYASAYGASMSTTYDPAKAAIVNAQNQANMYALSSQQKITYQMVQQALVKRTTLMPGQTVEGKVAAKWEDGEKYIIAIPFGEENHVVEFIMPEM